MCPLRVGVRACPALLVLSLMVAACAGPPSGSGPGVSGQSPTGPSRIAVAIKGDPPTLSNAIDRAGAGGTPGVAEVEKLISAGLAIADHQGRWQPQLSESVPTAENGLWRVLPDGRMETTWKIRQNAQWHDGAPFTADDLAFTARVGQDRELAAFSNRAYSMLESVETPDGRTVTARWKQPYIEADSMFTHSRAVPLPRHVLEQPYRENKAAFTELSYWNKDFVGTGPYKVREWTPGSHMVLEANDRYVLGRPKIDQIEVKFIPDPNTLIANIMAGTVDLTMGRGLSIEQVDTIRSQRADIARTEVSVGGCLCAFPQYLNPTPPAVADPQFRRALSHAMDRDALAQSLQLGLVPAAHIFIAPDTPEYPDIEQAVARYPYDPRRAIQLIEEAGYQRGADGIFRDVAGERLNVEMRTTASVEIGKTLLLAVTDYWQRIGIVAEPLVVPPQLAGDREWRANFPAFDLVNQSSNLTLLERFHGREAALPENNYRGNNRMRYRSPELDALIDRYFVTIPWAERMEVARQAIRHISEGVVAMATLYNANPTVLATRLENVQARGMASNAHEWRVRG